jgi:prepilin-type N-terminal cleavage/methylation domain-containing protein
MNRQGFTLIEVLISMVVFIVVLSGTLPLILMSANTGRNSYDMGRGGEALTMVMDRIVGARQVGAKLPGPNGTPNDVTQAPETGEQCYYLRSSDSRVPRIRDCREMPDNTLVSRSDIDDRYAIQWVTKREDALAGSPAIDNITVTVSWRKGKERIRRVTGVIRVPR